MPPARRPAPLLPPLAPPRGAERARLDAALSGRVVESLITAIKVGASDEVAARSVGLRPGDLRSVLACADDGDDRVAMVARELLALRAGAVIRDLRSTQRAGRDDWRAASWRLDRSGGMHVFEGGPAAPAPANEDEAVDDAIADLIERAGVAALRRAIE